MCNPFFCGGQKRHQTRMEDNHQECRKPLEPQKRTSKLPKIKMSPLTRSDRLAAMASTPSRVKTAKLTDIYTIPSSLYSTVEEIVAAQGYELTTPIGKGAYGTVYNARRLRDSQWMACKVWL